MRPREIFILFFEDPSLANATLLKTVQSKDHITILGDTYQLSYPAYYRAGKPVFVLLKGYPNSLQLRLSPEFENLLEIDSWHGYQREIGDYVASSLFARKVSLKDVLAIALLVAFACALTYIFTAHAYAGFGIVVPGTLIKRKKPLPKRTKPKVREWKEKRLMYNVKFDSEGKLAEDSLFIIAKRLVETKGIEGDLKVLTVALSNIHTAKYLGFMITHGADKKFKLPKLLSKIISLKFGSSGIAERGPV